ncbi:hypothetical protein [Agromyces sp. NPDC060279]|uniref:hypothetical protein n=1 Tax=Agromyces sp. NPDC060279 TaxID=3347092 RepID=UPI0036519DB2
MTQHASTSPVRWWLAAAGASALLAVVAGLMTAGVGMPRLPANIRVDAPEALRVTDASGASAELRLINDVQPRVDPQMFEIDGIDGTPDVPAEVPVDSDAGILMAGEAPPESRQVRGQGLDETGELRDFFDPIGSYVLIDDGEGTVLPEEPGAFGDRSAAMGTSGIVLEVDDPAVSRLFPGYHWTVRDESGAEAEAPAWDVQFDLAAAHEQGRTNLPLPLGWYASPVAKGLDAAAPWLLGGFTLVTVVTLAMAGWTRARNRRAAEAAWVDPEDGSR